MKKILAVLMMLMIASPLWARLIIEDDGDITLIGDWEARGSVDVTGQLSATTTDFSDIKEWLVYTFICGSEQARAYPDTMSNVRDGYMFTAPVDGEIVLVEMFADSCGAGGDSLIGDVSINSNSVFDLLPHPKLVPACGSRASSIDCASGRGPTPVLGKRQVNEGDLIECDLTTYGTFSTYPSGVILTVYFQPDHS